MSFEWQRIYFINFEENGGLFKRFQDWMEDEHIPEIKRTTKCFLVEYGKKSNVDARSDHLQIVSYTLYPRDQKSWDLFNENFREIFDKEFSREWFDFERTRRIFFYDIVSVPTEKDAVMTM